MNLIKSPFLQPIIPSFDEELLDLKDELSKHYQLFEDNQVLITKLPEKEKAPLSSLLNQNKRSFFNNNPKVQETHRIKFIGNLLKNMTYYNNFEGYLDDFFEKREKLLFANKDPQEIKLFLQDNLKKKLFLYQSISYRFVFLKYPNKELLSDLNLEIKNINLLIEKMDAVILLEKRTEDELVTEKHLYENFKQQMQDNFNFLTEPYLKSLLNDFADRLNANKKLQALQQVINQLPNHLNLALLLSPEEEISRFKLVNEKPLQIPVKLEEITKKLVILARENGINEDIAVDNGALLLFSVEAFFKKNFKEQARILDFSQFKYQDSQSDYQLLKWDIKLEKKNEFFFRKQRKGNEEFYLEKRLQGFSDSLINAWMNTLLINEEEEALIFIDKKVREYYEQHKKQLYLPEIYFEFFKAFLKLSLVSSRASLLRIFTYLNYFRHFERKIKLFVDSELEFANNRCEDNAFNFQNGRDFKESLKTNVYFPTDSYYYNEDDLLLIKEPLSYSKPIFYDISFQDFKQEMDFLNHISAFYINFKQEKVPLPGLSETLERPSFDNIDRQELLDQLLEAHSHFLLEKTRLLLKYKEIMPSLTQWKAIKGFIQVGMGTLSQKPRLNLFSDSLFQSYQAETSNIQALCDLLNSLMSYQKGLETKIWKENPDNKLYKLLEAHQEHNITLFSNEIIRTMERIEDSVKVLGYIFENQAPLEQVLIENNFLKVVIDKWQIIMEGITGVNEFLTEFLFLENDEILDNSQIYDNFLNFVKRASNENKTDSPKLKKALQSNSLQTKDKLILSLNLLEFIRIRAKIRKILYSLSFSISTFKQQQLVFIKDPIKIENILGITSNSNLLRNFISLDSLKCNTEILNLRNWIFYIVNQKKMEEPLLFLQFLFSLNSLANVYVLMNNFYFSRIRKEFFIQEQSNIALLKKNPVKEEKQYEIQGSNCINPPLNILESPLVHKKLSDCSQDFFLDVFERKKTAAFKILSLKRVSIFNTLTPEKGSMNKNKVYNPFFSKGYKSANAQIINDFTGYLNKEVYYEIMKLNTVLMRNSLEKLNSRLPNKLKFFKVVPLISPKTLSLGEILKASPFYSPSAQSNPLKPVEANKSFKKPLRASQNDPTKKGNSIESRVLTANENKASLDSPLLNMGILPSIEDIMKYKLEDIPKQSVIPQFEDPLLQEKLLIGKIQEARSEFKGSDPNNNTNNKAFEKINSKRKTSFLMTPASQIMAFRRTPRKKVLKQKEFEGLKLSPVYFLMNCLFHLFNILNNELAIRTLDNPFLDLLYFRLGLMDEEGFKSRKCTHESFHDLKRNIMRVSNKLNLVRDRFDQIDRLD